MNKDISLRKKQRKKLIFSLEDYEALARLLNHGYDIYVALEVITTKHNRLRIKELHNTLEKGEPICDHLIDIPGLDIHFQFFYHQTSLSLALKQSIAMYRYEKQIKQNFIKTCFYPSIVIGLSILVFLVIAQVILPMMIGLLSSMNLSFDKNLYVLVRWFSLLLLILAICCFAACVMLLFFLSKKRQVIFFLWLNRYFDQHVLKFILSYLFAGYWLEFQKQSCNTMDAINSLIHMEYRPLIKYCSILIEETLQKGYPLIEGMKASNMLTESFCFHFDVGVKCQQLDQFLEAFIEESRLVMERKIKKVIQIIQFGSYVLVGLIIAVMSQVLFAPMDLLSTLS